MEELKRLVDLYTKSIDQQRDAWNAYRTTDPNDDSELDRRRREWLALTKRCAELNEQMAKHIPAGEGSRSP